MAPVERGLAILAATAAAGAVFGILLSRAYLKPRMKKTTVKHILLGKFVENLPHDEMDALIKGYEELPKVISSMKGFEWGENVSKEGFSEGYTHAFVATFDNEAGLTAYLEHPLHKAFASGLLPKLEKVVVVDYIPEVTLSPHYS